VSGWGTGGRFIKGNRGLRAVEIVIIIYKELIVMKKAFLFGLTVALAAVIVLAGCGSAPASGVTVLKLSASDFQSDRNGILKINNYASFDVAIFAGKVERGTFIGAIKALGSRDFDISKIAGLPQKGAFLFRAVSYEKLSKNGKGGITEDNVVYAALVVYDLSQPDKKIDEDIFPDIDGTEETFFYVSNATKYVLELRIGHPDGEKVAALPPGQRNKKLWLRPSWDGYIFFPAYRYIEGGEWKAVFSKDLNGGILMTPGGERDVPSMIELSLPVTEEQDNWSVQLLFE
jgi:hypothetical protein